ncbi:protein G12 [Lasioglossum baleicum]|uniref:protein G12 n=1 Tax=Lasioglossum baleicum TaxID=434251 RepID=UPI003FCE8DFC
MNPQILIMSAFAAASVALISLLAYRMGHRSEEVDLMNQPPLKDNSSLDEDLWDILAFVPQNDIQEIVERYMKYDKQIGETVSFINDHKRFLIRELQNMPQVNRIILFLIKNGLDVDYWTEKLQIAWKMAPRYVRKNKDVATGGLTVMIDKILHTIPLHELNELLKQKVRYSGSFRRLLMMLKSNDFDDLCNSLRQNRMMHHHYFWAEESGLEVGFAGELLKDLHFYLTQTLLPC